MFERSSDHAAEDRLAHGDRGDGLGAGDAVALAHRVRRAEERDADVVRLEVEHEARDLAVGAVHFDELAGHRMAQAEHAGDAVADLQHRAGLVAVRGEVEVLELLLEDGADFVGFDLCRHDVLFLGPMRPRVADEVRRVCGGGWCR
jgi:hypothetical protein